MCVLNDTLVGYVVAFALPTVVVGYALYIAVTEGPPLTRIDREALELLGVGPTGQRLLVAAACTLVLAVVLPIHLLLLRACPQVPVLVGAGTLGVAMLARVELASRS